MLKQQEGFQTWRSTVLKWVRNRAQQSTFVDGLKEIAGLEKTTQNLRKCLRPSEIIKSNNIVENIVKTMREQFTHPFERSFDKDKLYNNVSGKPVSDDICQSLSAVQELPVMMNSASKS